MAQGVTRRSNPITTISLLALLTSAATLAVPGRAAAQGAAPGMFIADSVMLETPTGFLRGTVMLPFAIGKFPLVVIISGSGPTDRDGNSMGLPGKNNALGMLAQALADRGIASVRYDKRGVAASARAATSEEDLRFEMYADDAAGWVKKFRTDKRFSTIIIAGHSEGAMLGILAAQRAAADGYISIAGIARRADAVLHDQLAAGLLPAQAALADSVLAKLAAGKKVPVPREMPLSALFRASVQPYLISWFKWDPATELAKLTIPVLILQGTTDIQVAVAEADSLKRASPKATLVKVEGMNHVLKAVTGDQMTQLKSYSDPTLPLVAQLVTSIEQFVKEIRPAEHP
jgi:pimeloyl-ACP methyl ester carboxylesterase